MEALGTARLSDGIAADRAVTATISRGEIDDVLRETDGIPELTLRLADEGGTEQGRISMTWSRDDLERLLSAATGEGVVLTFDRDEIAAAFADVEAHGLRTRAAIFAVAAAGALGSGVGAAYAQIPGQGDAGTTPIVATGANTMVTDASTGGYATDDATVASSTTVTDASTGGYATDDATAASALQARSQATNEAYGLGSSAGDSIVTDASTGAGYAAAPTGGSSGTFDIQRPADEAALLVGGVLLTLAGAAFAVRRTAPPRPA